MKHLIKATIEASKAVDQLENEVLAKINPEAITAHLIALQGSHVDVGLWVYNGSIGVNISNDDICETIVYEFDSEGEYTGYDRSAPFEEAFKFEEFHEFMLGQIKGEVKEDA